MSRPCDWQMQAIVKYDSAFETMTLRRSHTVFDVYQISLHSHIL